jgi:hypothetical protein
MGEFFDVDRLDHVASIQPYLVWRKGERKLGSGRLHKRSGAFYLASDAEMQEFSRQIADATEYLETNGSDIAKIVSLPGVTSAVLDFAISLEEVQFNQSCRFTTNFLKLAIAAGLEIELTQYATSSESAES